MTDQSRLIVLSDEQWAVLKPLIDECRPRGKTEPVALRETVEAIVWRHQNGAKWRSVPPDLVPWWRAAQTFIRWSHLGVWERLLERVQERGVELGMAFLDGTSIRAHHKAAGAPKKGGLEGSATCVRRLAALAVVRHQGLRDHRWCRPGDQLRSGPRSGPRTPPGPGSGRLPARRSRRRRQRLCLARVPPVHLGPGCPAGDPGQEKRSARVLPRLDLQQSQPRRAPVGAPQGMARRRNPLRENRPILHGRALPCRHLRLRAVQFCRSNARDRAKRVLTGYEAS